VGRARALGGDVAVWMGESVKKPCAEADGNADPLGRLKLAVLLPLLS
jgi:hypothetical protein